MDNTPEANLKLFESFSFYYLNVIKSTDKLTFYETKDLLERVNW